MEGQQGELGVRLPLSRPDSLNAAAGCSGSRGPPHRRPVVIRQRAAEAHSRRSARWGREGRREAHSRQ